MIFCFSNGTFVFCTDHPISETTHPVSETAHPVSGTSVSCTGHLFLARRVPVVSLGVGGWCMRRLSEKVSPVFRDTPRLRFYGLGGGVHAYVEGKRYLPFLVSHQGCGVRD